VKAIPKLVKPIILYKLAGERRCMRIDENSNIAKVIEELKRNPGRSMTMIARNIGVHSSSVTNILLQIRKLEDPEIKTLLAKREAYVKGGEELVRMIRENPGISYIGMTKKLKEKVISSRTTYTKPDKLLEGLIGYCKRYKDKELKEVLIRHKKAGGWMP